MSQPTTYTQFGPDPALSTLPAAFLSCLPPGAPTTACDDAVGSLASGQGWCSQPAYAHTTFCACVNNAIPCPMIASAACANSAFAYLQAAQLPPDGEKYKACKGQPICVNLVEVGGNQNVVSGITQQCGIITNIKNTITANPTLAVLAFLLFLTLIILLTLRTDGGGSERAPPPPPPGLFGDAFSDVQPPF